MCFSIPATCPAPLNYFNVFILSVLYLSYQSDSKSSSKVEPMGALNSTACKQKLSTPVHSTLLDDFESDLSIDQFIILSIHRIYHICHRSGRHKWSFFLGGGQTGQLFF